MPSGKRLFKPGWDKIKGYLPDAFSLASNPSNALLVISNRASSGDALGLATAGLSGESLSDLSERESSSADRGLDRREDAGPSKSHGRTMAGTEVLCKVQGLWFNMSFMKKELRGLLLGAATETKGALALDGAIHNFFMGLKYSSSSEGPSTSEETKGSPSEGTLVTSMSTSSLSSSLVSSPAACMGDDATFSDDCDSESVFVAILGTFSEGRRNAAIGKEL